MVVDHAHRLHIRVADGRADELEAPLEEVLAERVRLGGLGGHPIVAIDPRSSVDESPDISIEAAELLLHREEGLRIRYGTVDLQPVAHDALVLHEPSPAAGVES